MQPRRHQIGVHFANKVFTNRYSRRPKTSLRMRIAKLKFPRIMAPSYRAAYGKCPEEASPIAIMLSPKAIVKSFLCTFERRQRENGPMLSLCVRNDATDLYVLNHSCQRIHFETFFLGLGAGLAAGLGS